MLVLKWAWRYHSHDLDYFDSIEDAVYAAEAGSDAGEEASDCIEVIENDGTSRILTAAEYGAIADKRRAAEDASYVSRLPIVVVIQVQHPEGQWVTWSGYPTREEANKRLAEWQPFLGDRVRVEVR